MTATARLPLGVLFLILAFGPVGVHLRAEDLPPAADKAVDFRVDIEPLLKRRCYSCHSEESQEGGLRLDSRRRLMAGGDRGAVVVPGRGAASRLLRIVAGRDEDVGRMPPEGEGTPLTADEIALLRTWIDQGAHWPGGEGPSAASRHWAFQPIRRPAPPRQPGSTWSRNPIDAFVARRHRQEQVVPSPEAAPSTLVRRLYLDLLGLPPGPDEVRRFLADPRSDAYERLVDRVLASPHYGERWARHWLDLARYADSDGYEKDRPRPHAWRFRQWVIEALNADLPYDAFSIQQIAGDMLPAVGSEPRVASGFHRNTLHNTEGGVDPEEDRVKKTVDRTNTVASIWLGLSLGCAQCHSHKYDPITQREYYSFYAFFNNINEVEIAAPLAAERTALEAALAEHERVRTGRVEAIANYEQQQLPAAQRAWEQAVAGRSLAWATVRPQAVKSVHGADFQIREDGGVLARGENRVSDVYTVELVPPPGPITALRLEVLPDASLPKRGPGRAENGNFVLTTLRVQVTGIDGLRQTLRLSAARADFAQADWAVEQVLNDDAKDGWAVSPEVGQRHVAVFELAEPLEVQSGESLVVTLDQTYHQSEPHNIGCFRISLTDAPVPVALEGLPDAVVAALGTPAAQRTTDQIRAVATYYREIDAGLRNLRQTLTAHEGRRPAASATKARAVAEASSAREAYVHVRGDFLSRGPQVEPLGPEVLPAVSARGQRPDRLDLARWLFRDEHPLTARVTVNRVWQRFFGRGLVASSDDFGSQGDPPSHPDLLDWLANDLREHDWSLKHLHRRIVTSATYRQSSVVRPALLERDPDNVLLARQTRRRVEAEVIRDVSLAASGLLDRRIGGPSVRPPQPDGYSALTYANSAKWQLSPGGDRYRRGVYTFFQRTSPYPMLMTFDSPDSTACTTRRSVSNTPLQALTLWNDRVFFECARRLGLRIVEQVWRESEDAETIRRRASYGVLLCLGRPATSAEAATLGELFEAQRQWLGKSPDHVQAIVGESGRQLDEPPEDLAAWILVGRVLLNLDEFITRE